MSDFRYINTKVWKDPWFVDLRLTEQHLFLYLLTNPQTNMAGIYEISLREMSFDTTIEQEEIKRIFRDRFQPDGKAFYELGWVVMKNWLKHQKPNPNQITAIVTKFNSLPGSLLEKLNDSSNSLYIPYPELIQGFESFSKAYESVTPNINKINIIKLNKLTKPSESLKDVDKFKKGFSM